MALVLTPEVFFDLMKICLAWEWDGAVDRAKASYNRERQVYPTQIGWTTVDKIVRILFGLGIVSKKQKGVLYRDRRLQYLVLHNSETTFSGDGRLESVLHLSKKDVVLQCDRAKEINREKMLRDMRFFITESGRGKTTALLAKYAASITKAAYFAEIERQANLLPQTLGTIENVITNYRKKVATETKE